MAMAGIFGIGTGGKGYNILKIDELEVIYRNDDGCEAIKLVFMGADGYEVGDDELYLDDLEDEALDWEHRINETDDESEEEEEEEEESDYESD